MKIAPDWIDENCSMQLHEDGDRVTIRDAKGNFLMTHADLLPELPFELIEKLGVS